MDRLTHYRTTIKRLRKDYANQGLDSDEPGTDRILITDEPPDNYLLFHLNWGPNISRGHLVWAGQRVGKTNPQAH